MRMTINYKDMNDRNLKRILSKGTVLDLGGGKPWATGWIHEKYRELLEKGAYCLDYDGSKCPHIVGDIQNLSFKDDSIDGIICNAVLEHVPQPHKAVDEIFRILKPGGEAFIYVPFLFVFHTKEDYFRFTDKAIASLFKDFDEVIIQPGMEGMGGVIASLMVFDHEHLSRILRILVGKPLNLLYKLIFYCYFSLIKKAPDVKGRINETLYLRNTHGYHFVVRKGLSKDLEGKS